MVKRVRRRRRRKRGGGDGGREAEETEEERPAKKQKGKARAESISAEPDNFGDIKKLMIRQNELLEEANNLNEARYQELVRLRRMGTDALIIFREVAQKIVGEDFEQSVAKSHAEFLVAEKTKVSENSMPIAFPGAGMFKILWKKNAEGGGKAEKKKEAEKGKGKEVEMDVDAEGELDNEEGSSSQTQK